MTISVILHKDTNATLSPGAMTWSQKSQRRQWDLFSPGKLGIIIDEGYQPGINQWIGTGSGASLSSDKGSCSLALTGNSQCGALYYTTTVAPFITNMLEVQARTQASTNWSMFWVGLFLNDASGKGLYVSYDDFGHTINIEYRNGGAPIVLSTTPLTIGSATAFRLYMMLNDNFVSAWVSYNVAGNWSAPQLYGVKDVRGDVTVASVFKPRVESNFQSFLPGWQILGGNQNQTYTLSHFKCGLSGQMGLIGYHPVRWADGTPYMDGNWVYLTCESQGLGSNEDIGGGIVPGLGNVSSTHWSIWKMNVKSYDMVQTGAIFFRRPLNVGGATAVVGDNDGDIVYDGVGFRIISNSLADGFWEASSQSYLYYKYVEDDVLHGVSIIDQPAKLTGLPDYNLGTTDNNDPALIQYGGKWFLGYGGSNGNNFLVSTTDFITWTIETSNYGTDVDGSRFVTIGNAIYLLTTLISDGVSRMAIHTFPGMVLTATVDTALQDVSVPPHPTIVPYLEQGKTKFLQIGWLTSSYLYNGMKWSMGPTITLVANESVTGYAVDLRQAPSISGYGAIMTECYLYTIDEAGDPVAGVTVYWELTSRPSGMFIASGSSASDSNGRWAHDFEVGLTLNFWTDANNAREFVIPDDAGSTTLLPS